MTLDALYEHATVLLFVRHKSEQETIHELMADGLEEPSARKIVKDLLERVALAKQEVSVFQRFGKCLKEQHEN